MKQQINLYLDEFRQERELFTVVNILRFQGLIIVILLLLTVWEIGTRVSMQQQLNETRVSVAEAADRNNALRASYGRQTESPRLQEEVARVEQNLGEKRALLRYMEGRDFGNTAGFSEYLADLSRFHITGLRLTHVSLLSGGLSLQLGGEVSRAEFVPLYLQNLRQGESYIGRNFETLKIIEADEDQSSAPGALVFDVVSAGQY